MGEMAGVLANPPETHPHPQAPTGKKIGAAGLETSIKSMTGVNPDLARLRTTSLPSPGLVTRATLYICDPVDRVSSPVYSNQVGSVLIWSLSRLILAGLLTQHFSRMSCLNGSCTCIRTDQEAHRTSILIREQTETPQGTLMVQCFVLHGKSHFRQSGRSTKNHV